jgi:hypothetical protein
MASRLALAERNVDPTTPTTTDRELIEWTTRVMVVLRKRY